MTVITISSEGPALQPLGLTGVTVYVTVWGESEGLLRLSAIIYPSGSPEAFGVNPVTPPVAAAVKSNVTNPLVNLLGLCSLIPVTELSQIEASGYTGKTLGVGFTCTTTTLEGPDEQPLGLTGTIV